MFTILDYSSALEYSIIRRYTNIVYYLLLLLLWYQGGNPNYVNLITWSKCTNPASIHVYSWMKCLVKSVIKSLSNEYPLNHKENMHAQWSTRVMGPEIDLIPVSWYMKEHLSTTSCRSFSRECSSTKETCSKGAEQRGEWVTIIYWPNVMTTKCYSISYSQWHKMLNLRKHIWIELPQWRTLKDNIINYFIRHNNYSSKT